MYSLPWFKFYPPSPKPPEKVIDLNFMASKISNEYIDVKAPPFPLVGAKGDGSTDDTVALQSIITYAELKGLRVKFSPGIYIKSDKLYVSTKTYLGGPGSRLCVIKDTSISSGIVVNGSADSGVYYWNIHGIELDGNNIGTVGIELNYAREGFSSFIYVSKYQKGLKTYKSWSNSFSHSEIVHNLDTNIELGDSANDFNLIDVQFDFGGNYGLRITGTDINSLSEAVNLYGCTAQSCGKDGIIADTCLVRGLNINGGYFENNNTLGTGTANINILRALGVVLCGGNFWPSNNAVHLNLDDVIGVTILGPHFASASAPYSVQTSAKTESVHILGGYNGNPNNDVGNAITDFRSPTFRGSGGVRADFASWTLDAPDNTKPPMLALKLAGASKGQLTLGSNGDLYLQHYNTNTLSMENVFNVNYKNEFKLYKAITGLRNESGATASRPAGLNNTTDKGYQFFDTTLGKPVWWAGANWKDATGVIV